MAEPKFKTPTGTDDILPQEQRYYEKVIRTVKEFANFYNFKRIETPIIEKEELFEKGIGSSTDIVEKQMFLLKGRRKNVLALRPEGTSPIARAYIEHGMKSWSQPVKLWHFGPFFRHEKPQAGRFREFYQFGFEVLGQKNPVIDAQIIQIFYNILKRLKFKDLIIEINSIGDSNCRPKYKEDLVEFLKKHKKDLCDDCKRRLKKNPLRVLDCKEEKCQPIIDEAPQIVDYLCKECNNHFKAVLEFLDFVNLPYNLNPHLVRGLDYYTKTVFEIFEKEKGSLKKKSKALISGGRYDELIELLGGEETPGCGGAAGVERIIEAMKEKRVRLPRGSKPKIFLAQLGKLAKSKTLVLIEKFREENIPVAESIGRDSLKAQLKKADDLGVKYTLILGQKEATEGEIIIRNMETGKQKTLKLKGIVRKVKRRIK